MGSPRAEQPVCDTEEIAAPQSGADLVGRELAAEAKERFHLKTREENDGDGRGRSQQRACQVFLWINFGVMVMAVVIIMICGLPSLGVVTSSP